MRVGFVGRRGKTAGFFSELDFLIWSASEGGFCWGLKCQSPSVAHFRARYQAGDQTWVHFSSPFSGSVVKFGGFRVWSVSWGRFWRAQDSSENQMSKGLKINLSQGRAKRQLTWQLNCQIFSVSINLMSLAAKRGFCWGKSNQVNTVEHLWPRDTCGD